MLWQGSLREREKRRGQNHQECLHFREGSRSVPNKRTEQQPPRTRKPIKMYVMNSEGNKF